MGAINSKEKFLISYLFFYYFFVARDTMREIKFCFLDFLISFYFWVMLTCIPVYKLTRVYFTLHRKLKQVTQAINNLASATIEIIVPIVPFGFVNGN